MVLNRPDPATVSNTTLGTTTGSLSWSAQATLGEASVTAPETATDLWTSLTRDTDGLTPFLAAVVRAARSVATDADAQRGAFHEQLAEAGVAGLRSASPPTFATAAGDATAARGLWPTYAATLAFADDGTPAWWKAVRATQQLGSGAFGRVPSRLEDLRDGPLRLLALADVRPSVSVELTAGFRDVPREQRESILRLVVWLGEVADVRVVGTDYTGRWLAHTHGDDLPPEFRNDLTATGQPSSIVEERVAAARDEFDPDGPHVATLRALAESNGHVPSQAALVDALDVQKERVSQLLTDLEDVTLVERVDTGSEKRVELLKSGSALLDAVDAEYGRQAELDSQLRDTGKQSQQYTCNPTASREGGEEEPAETATAGGHSTEYLTRKAHHAAAGAAADGGVTTVTTPSIPAEKKTRYVSYDEHRDEVVVATRASTPMSYIVSVAVGLGSKALLSQALPEERYENIDAPADILRSVRCIGGLSDETADDAEAFRNRLHQWARDIEDMTSELAGDCDDRGQLVSDILRSSHGLAGTVVHLLDEAGVDVVRELHIPSGVDTDALQNLAKTISTATAIQSKYGGFAVYRQLFEDRDKKREAVPTPDVDAADPLGDYIGGIVLRGPDAHRLADHVERALPTPRERHEDAPEIAVDVSLKEPTSAAYTSVVNRMADLKNLEVPAELHRLFRALAGSPYAAAEAIHTLGKEDVPREMYADEVRTALATLDADRLLSDCPPTAGKALRALLRSVSPLSQTELAEAADVSTRSLRTHTDLLTALTIVEETDDGLRVALPAREERGSSRRPDVFADDLAAAQDLLYDAALALVDDVTRFGDPEDPLGAAFLGRDFDVDALRAAVPDLDPWIAVASALCDDPEPDPTTVVVGQPTEQAALNAEVNA